MAKVKMPKKIAGYRVPKAIRKNPILKSMLSNRTGRDLLAKAIMAGAGAAAAVLVEERHEIAGATKQGGRKGSRALSLVGEAVHRGSDAALDVVREAAASVLPKKAKKSAKENPQRGAVH